MSQQCGNCTRWDRDNAEHFDEYSVANCLFPIPKLPVSLICMKQTQVANVQGKDCPVYKEHKE